VSPAASRRSASGSAATRGDCSGVGSHWGGWRLAADGGGEHWRRWRALVEGAATGGREGVVRRLTVGGNK